MEFKKFLIVSFISSLLFVSELEARMFGRSSDYPLEFVWGEFSPFAATVKADGQYSTVPLQYMGRLFLDGESLKSSSYPPEYQLAYLLGMFGSAFEIDPNYFKKWWQSIGFYIVQGDFLHSNDRLYPAKINNWAKKSTNVNDCDSAKLNCTDELSFIDGAISGLNLPIPLLEDREVDILFLFDNSATIANSPTLQVANQYIENGRLQNYVKMDPSWANQSNQDVPLKVYNDPRNDDYDSSKRVVVYLPFRSGDSGLVGQYGVDCINDFCNTLNFQYSPGNIQQVTGATKSQLLAAQNDVQEIITAWSNKNS